MEERINSLRVKHLNNAEKQSLYKLCVKYNDICHLQVDVLSSTKTITHSINLTNDTPTRANTYKYLEVHKDEVKIE